MSLNAWVQRENILPRGLPTPKEEEWRYTDLREVAEKTFSQPATGAIVNAAELRQNGLVGKTIFVLVNGRFEPSLSNTQFTDGIVVKSLAEFFAKRESDQRIGVAFDSTTTLHQRSLSPMNQALLTDGCAVIVEKGARVNELEILHVSTDSQEATLHSPRLLVVLEELAEARLVERFLALGKSERFCCAVSELVLADGAQCDYYVINDQNDLTTHYHSIQAQVSQRVALRTHLFPFGGKFVRNEVNYNLLGQNSHSTINALTVLTKNQHVDNSTVIRHAVPNCQSSELFKGIYGEQSHGVFQGTIVVEKDAQKTNAFQSNQALLLSRDASIDSKPQLKIWADDVKCTHGATVGELDSQALFYLKSRGISHQVAAAMLTEAFAGEVISGVRIPALADNLRQRLYKKLGIEVPQ